MSFVQTPFATDALYRLCVNPDWLVFSWVPVLGWMMTVAVLTGLFGTPIVQIILAYCRGEVCNYARTIIRVLSCSL